MPSMNRDRDEQIRILQITVFARENEEREARSRAAVARKKIEDLALQMFDAVADLRFCESALARATENLKLSREALIDAQMHRKDVAQ